MQRASRTAASFLLVLLSSFVTSLHADHPKSCPCEPVTWVSVSAVPDEGIGTELSEWEQFVKSLYLQDCVVATAPLSARQASFEPRSGSDDWMRPWGLAVSRLDPATGEWTSLHEDWRARIYRDPSRNGSWILMMTEQFSRNGHAFELAPVAADADGARFRFELIDFIGQTIKTIPFTLRVGGGCEPLGRAISSPDLDQRIAKDMWVSVEQIPMMKGVHATLLHDKPLTNTPLSFVIDAEFFDKSGASLGAGRVWGDLATDRPTDYTSSHRIELADSACSAEEMAKRCHSVVLKASCASTGHRTNGYKFPWWCGTAEVPFRR